MLLNQKNIGSHLASKSDIYLWYKKKALGFFFQSLQPEDFRSKKAISFLPVSPVTPYTSER